MIILKIPKAQGTHEARRREEEKPIKKMTKRRSSPFIIIRFIIIFMGCNLNVQGNLVKNHFFLLFDNYCCEMFIHTTCHIVLKNARYFIVKYHARISIFFVLF